MDEETWLTALEATALGFVDAIEDGIPAAASASDLRRKFDTFAKRNMENIQDAVAEAAPAVELVEETPAVVEAEVAAPEITEEPAAEEPAPEAKADDSAEKLAALEAEKAEAIARAEAAEAELSKVKDAFAALEKSAGVSAATVAPVAKSEESDPVAQWMAAVEAKDFAASNKLYAEHKKAIWAARASLSKATS
jgi:hypothetical protein